MRIIGRIMLWATLIGALLLPGTATAAPGQAFPPLIHLPDGFNPEGIASGRGHTFFVGSIATGAVYRGDLRTGQGRVLVESRAGRYAIGLKVDSRDRLFVAGGPTGQAYVYHAGTGAEIATYQLTTAASTFVNDVVVTRTAAWFTDSFNAVLYRLPIKPDGTLGSPAEVTALPLTGDFVLTPGFNINGIDATAAGTTLIIVQSNTGRLFTVDPTSGRTQRIDLGSGAVLNGDGILLHGRTLYVVQNFNNRVAVVELAPTLTSGTIVRYLTDPALDIPTTIARVGRRLYAVNARFTTLVTPTTDYAVVQLRAHPR